MSRPEYSVPYSEASVEMRRGAVIARKVSGGEEYRALVGTRLAIGLLVEAGNRVSFGHPTDTDENLGRVPWRILDRDETMWMYFGVV